MNLTINPMNLNSCNCPKPQANFGALPIKVLKPTNEQTYLPLARQRDVVADKFSKMFEDAAKKVELNTDSLRARKFALSFNPEGAYSANMKARVVCDNNCELSALLPEVDTSTLRFANTENDFKNYNQKVVEPFVNAVKLILNA